MSEQLRIGQLAGLAGVKTDSVRFYERSGLLPKPVRSANGYRTVRRGGTEAFALY